MSRTAAAASVSKATTVPSAAKASVPSVGTAVSPPTERSGSHPFVDGFNGAVVVDVPIGDINPDDLTFQYRFKTRVTALCAAIARQGQEEPVHLTDSKPHRIIDGFQRVSAIRELGWLTVKAFVHNDISDEKAHEIAFTQNTLRTNLTPIDKAHAIVLARKRGLRDDAIARDLGMSERQLHRYAGLLEFSKPVQELVDADEISMAHAAVLARFDGIKLVDWVEKSQNNKWSAMDLRREIRRASRNPAATTEHRYLMVKGDVLRIYDSQIRRDVAPAERKRIAAEIKEALKFLEG